MAASIFISHASQDRKVAATLCAALESRGFQCWISSRDILPGENFQVAIVRAIRKVKIMLLVFTANSNTSEEMTKELALASQQKLMVVPLRIEDVAAGEAFSYEFATRQWIDFFADWELAMDQLSVRLANALGVEPAPPKLVPKAEAPVAAPVEAVAAVETLAATPAPQPESVAKAESAPPPPKVEAPPPAAVAKVEASAAAPRTEAPAPLAAPVEPVAKPADVAAKTPEAKPVAPVAKAPPAAEPKVEPKKPDTVAGKPTAPASTVVMPAAAKKSPVGLIVAIGVVLLIVVGLVVAVPMFMGKKTDAKAELVVKGPPAKVVPAAVPTVTLATPNVTDPTAVPVTDPNAPPAIDPNAPPVTPHVKKPPKAHHPKSDVPY